MAAPQLIVEDPENEFDWAVDWKELMAESSPKGPDAFSYEKAEATLVGEIPANKKRSAMLAILGRSSANEGAPYDLYRTQPVTHPEYPYLRATSVAFDDYAPAGNMARPVAPGSAAWQGAYIPKRTAAAQNLYITDQGFYQATKCTIRFNLLPYNLYADDDPYWDGVSEIDRNVHLFESTDPTLQLLLADGGSPFMAWAETWLPDATTTPKKPGGPSLTGVTGPSGSQAANASLNIPLPEYLQQCDFVLNWRAVAKEFVCKNNVPVRLLNGLGTVNKTDWLEFPAGTLLMSSARIQYFQWPYYYDKVAFGCHVSIGLKWFDPPRGALSPIKRGHQVLPYSRSGLYASAVRQFIDVTKTSPPLPAGTLPVDNAPDVNNPPLFKETDYNDLFKSAWMPIT